MYGRVDISYHCSSLLAFCSIDIGLRACRAQTERNGGFFLYSSNYKSIQSTLDFAWIELLKFAVEKGDEGSN